MRKMTIHEIAYGTVVASQRGEVPSDDRLMLICRERYDSHKKQWRVRVLTLRSVALLDEGIISIGENTAWWLVAKNDEES